MADSDRTTTRAAAKALVTRSQTTTTTTSVSVSPRNTALSSVARGTSTPVRTDLTHALGNMSPVTPSSEKDWLADIRTMGVQLGLTGTALAKFVFDEKLRHEEKAERQAERDRLEAERQAERDRFERLERERREERKEERERQERERERQEREHERQEREHERQERERKEEREFQLQVKTLELKHASETRDLELEQQKAARQEELQAIKTAYGDRSESSFRETSHHDSFRVRIDPMGEKDDIDTYLKYFESIAESHEWPKKLWAIRLAPYLRGKARDTYLRLTPTESKDFDIVKASLLEEYHRTPQYYCRQFREARKESDESFKQFLKRIQLLLDRWLQTAEVNKTDGEAMYDLFLKEQLMNTFNTELAQHVYEKQPESAEKAAEVAFWHLEAKRLGRSMSGGNKNDKNKSKKNQNGKDEDSQGDESDSQSNPSQDREKKKFDPSQIVCYNCKQKGHKRAQCEKPVENRGIKTSLKTPTSKDWTDPSSVLCGKCEKKPFHSEGPLTVNGQKAWGLRDSGADLLFVKPHLVNESDYTGDHVEAEMADVVFKKHYPTAYVNVVTPFMEGRFLAVVVDSIRPDVYIGNFVLNQDKSWVTLSAHPKRKLVTSVKSATRKKRGLKTKTIPVSNFKGLGVSTDKLIALQKEDQTLARAWDAAKNNKPVSTGNKKISFSVSNGVLVRTFQGQKTSQVCVPDTLRAKVMHEAHCSQSGKHVGPKKTLEQIWRAYYWPGMCGMVRQSCRSCVNCQSIKDSMSDFEGSMSKGSFPLSPMSKGSFPPSSPKSEKRVTQSLCSIGNVVNDATTGNVNVVNSTETSQTSKQGHYSHFQCNLDEKDIKSKVLCQDQVNGLEETSSLNRKRLPTDDSISVHARKRSCLEVVQSDSSPSLEIRT